MSSDGVGYGRPPEHSRFRKGRSGNPKGRPRKSQPDLTLSELPTLKAASMMMEGKITVREGGEPIEITRQEALLKAIFASAFKGNARSQATLLVLSREVEAMKAYERQESIAFWRWYKEHKSKILADAVERGEPAPLIFPHPDDVVIDCERGVRIVGPVDEEEQARVEHSIRFREVLIMQDVLDRRTADAGRFAGKPGGAGLSARLMEHGLPPRLRLTEGQWVRRMIDYGRLPQRQLLKQLYAAWRAVGAARPRGFLYPDLDRVHAYLAFHMDLAKEVMNRPMTEEDIAQRILEFDRPSRSI